MPGDGGTVLYDIRARVILCDENTPVRPRSHHICASSNGRLAQSVPFDLSYFARQIMKEKLKPQGSSTESSVS